jgi:hypothetical protein
MPNCTICGDFFNTSAPVLTCQLHRSVPEAPAPVGPFYVMADDDTTASAPCERIEDARAIGQELADAEPLPCSFSIQDGAGEHVEDITRSNGRDLSAQMAAFDATRDANG